jgi:hypothetical protein
MVLRTRILHKTRERDEQATEVFNLRKIKDSEAAIGVTFEHAGVFLREVSTICGEAIQGLRNYDRNRLRRARARQRKIQQWSNIIAANVFKVLRLLQWEEVAHTQRYAQTIGSLQEITESLRDIVVRTKLHVSNQHAGPLEAQVAEMERVWTLLREVLDHTSQALLQKASPDPAVIAAHNRELRMLVHEYDQNQIMRIQDNTSKTRLSILFYALMWDALKIAEQTTYLLNVFREPLAAGTPPRPGPQASPPADPGTA